MTHERLINGHERDVPKDTLEWQNALKGPYYGGTIAMYGGLIATWSDNSHTDAYDQMPQLIENPECNSCNEKDENQELSHCFPK